MTETKVNPEAQITKKEELKRKIEDHPATNIIHESTRHYLEGCKRLDNSNKLEHAYRIMDQYEHYFGNIPPNIIIAILMHDIVDSNIENNQVRQELIETITNQAYCASLDIQESIKNGIAFAISGDEIEKVAEEWRSTIMNNDDYINTQIEKIQTKCTISENKETMKSEMRKIIIDREQQNIPDWLKKFTPPMANLDTMLETIETWDIEGLVIKAIEVLDNMRHPNPENEAATFIDAMEMIYFYAPLLEIAGFDNLASDCYSIAYEYLYTDEFSKKELETIKSIREKAKTAQETFNSKIIPEIQNQLQLQEKGINRNTINARVKTTGSILKKICEARPELERKNIVPPDILAFTIIIDEEHNNLDTIDSILSMIITILHEYGYHTGHSRDEAQIEYSAKEHNKKYSSIPYGEKKYYHYSINLNLSDYPQEWINIDFEESKSSGLQLIHCSFMNKDPHKMPEEDRKIKLDTDTITVEVRIITEEMHTSSNHGEHSHPIYKSSKDPNSKLNQLKQASTQNDNDKKAFEEEKERIIKIQQTIRLRGKIFTNTQDTLKANEASRIKAENMFNMIC